MQLKCLSFLLTKVCINLNISVTFYAKEPAVFTVIILTKQLDIEGQDLVNIKS